MKLSDIHERTRTFILRELEALESSRPFGLNAREAPLCIANGLATERQYMHLEYYFDGNGRRQYPKFYILSGEGWALLAEFREAKVAALPLKGESNDS